MLKIWHISDTHSYHTDLPQNVEADIVVHSGDCCNSQAPHWAREEWRIFSEWFPSLKFKHKILVFGNHDIFAAQNPKVVKQWAESNNITILQDSYVEIEGIKFFGSPFTPTYGSGWVFNTNRNTIGRRWQKIHDDTQVVVTHGPPQGILDLTQDKGHDFRQGGDSALYKRLQKLPNLKAHLFGHFHDEPGINNQGILIKNQVQYSNAACMRIGYPHSLASFGNLISINN